MATFWPSTISCSPSRGTWTGPTKHRQPSVREGFTAACVGSSEEAAGVGSRALEVTRVPGSHAMEVRVLVGIRCSPLRARTIRRQKHATLPPPPRRIRGVHNVDTAKAGRLNFRTQMPHLPVMKIQIQGQI
eukprot:2513281-Prymnesium_polylepis.1